MTSIMKAGTAALAVALIGGLAGCEKKVKTETAKAPAQDRSVEAAEESVEKAGRDVDETIRDAGKTVDEATASMVTAEVTRIDEDSRRVTFTVKDTKEDIRLQAGKEISVSFAEIAVLTGRTEAEAIEKLHEGDDLEVQVTGIGDAMKITKIDLSQLEKETEKPLFE